MEAGRRSRTAGRARAAALIAGAGVVAALASCTGGAAPEPSTSSSPIGGQAVCDEATVTEVVRTDIDANYPGSTFVSLDSLACEGGWAVAETQIEASGATLPAVVFLRAEGQFWVPTTVEEICATPQAQTTVPPDIYTQACGVA